MQQYEMPEVPKGTKVANLVSEDAAGHELLPTTQVLCINRGRTLIRDKFDGRDYVIPVGHFQLPYGAAKHIQRRAIVPGTRDPYVRQQNGLGGFVSFIGICGLDPNEKCQRFTDAQLEKMGEKVEALNRDAFIEPGSRSVRIEGVNGRGGGSGRSDRTGVDGSAQATTGATAALATAFEKPKRSASEIDEAAAQSERGTSTANAPVVTAEGDSDRGRGNVQRLSDIKERIQG